MNTWNAERVGTGIFGVGLSALGLFIGVETSGMDAGPNYAAVGPRAFPALIAAGLVLVGLIQLKGAFKARAADGEQPRHDWHAVGWIAGTLMAQLLLLPWVGWIPAATLVFIGVARALGEKRLVPTVALGVVLAVGTFGLFNHVLGLDLPAGQLFQFLSSP